MQTHLLHHVDEHLLELLTALGDKYYVAAETLPVLPFSNSQHLTTRATSQTIPYNRKPQV